MQTHDHGAAHGSTRSYLLGFLLSLLLTLASFGLVMDGTYPAATTLGAIVAAAVLQILVQMHFFLHLDRSSSQRWNVMVLLYTLIIIAFLVGGTLWIMHNTAIRMMPMPMSMPMSMSH
jgi:cytochrome o ubiquinol oxidase operon protein cyoD